MALPPASARLCLRRRVGDAVVAFELEGADQATGDPAIGTQCGDVGAVDASADFFASLHAASHRAGAVLLVPAGVRLSEPLHVLSAISPGGVDTGHVLVVLEEGAEATVITETAGGGDAGTADMLLKNGTQLDDFRLYNKVLSGAEINAIMSGSQ